MIDYQPPHHNRLFSLHSRVPIVLYCEHECRPLLRHVRALANEHRLNGSLQKTMPVQSGERWTLQMMNQHLQRLRPKNLPKNLPKNQFRPLHLHLPLPLPLPQPLLRHLPQHPPQPLHHHPAVSHTTIAPLLLNPLDSSNTMHPTRFTVFFLQGHASRRYASPIPVIQHNPIMGPLPVQ